MAINNPRPEPKYMIEWHIKEALKLIEPAIRDEPEYVGWFVECQHKLEEADFLNSFPIHD